MRKTLAFSLTLSLALSLCACSESSRIPSLEEIVENGAEWGSEQIHQVQGCTLADLEKAWGTPILTAWATRCPMPVAGYHITRGKFIVTMGNIVYFDKKYPLYISKEARYKKKPVENPTSTGFFAVYGQQR